MASAAIAEVEDSPRNRRRHIPARANGVTITGWKECVSDANFIAAWDALETAASEPNPFYCQWNLLPALRAFDPNGDVALLQLWQDDRLIGLLPLSQSNSYYGYPLPHLTSWLHENGFCGVPLIALGCEKEFWEAVLAAIDREYGASMFLHLCHVPENGPVFSALADLIAEQPRPAAIVHREQRALLQSDLTPDAYLAASMSGKKRKELRRQTKRLGEHGKVTFDCVTGSEGLGRWCDSFLAMERAGWKGREGSALASQVPTEQFFRDALRGAAKAGKLERLTLHVSDKPVAMLASFVTPPGAFAFKTTFDEDYARFSPGVLLQCENLKILDNPNVEWTDSCAAADHPMIDRIWREKRSIVRLSIGIGGKVRQIAFRQLLRAESGSEMIGGQR